jgi:hypothetical protein
MAGTIGGLVYFLNRPAEAEVVEEVDEGIDYSTAQILNIAKESKVRLQQSGVSPSMLIISIDLILPIIHSSFGAAFDFIQPL